MADVPAAEKQKGCRFAANSPQGLAAACFFTILENGFVEFLENMDATDLKSEYLLPTIIGGFLEEKKLSVRVLHSKDKWFGVTYNEDKVDVVNAINNLIETGVYPNKLF